jgi:hypothetical protein
MSERRRSSRRVVRRITYSDGENTVDVTTVITPNRPSREPPPIPGTVEAPPISISAPVLSRFPVSERFLETITRAATMVDGEHPLAVAAEELGRSIGSVQRFGPVRMPRRTGGHVHTRPKIIYDTVTVDSTNTIGETDKCPICITEYKEGEIGGVLPCQHNFHDECIRTWVDENRTCPLCRLQLA